MKYVPLVWAALRRKPIRAAVTFLSVTVAFTLFGLMIGLNATMNRMEERAHADRIWTLSRFDLPGMPVTVARRIAQLPGVKRLSIMSYVNGYVGDPKNRAGIIFLDDVYGTIFPDQGPSAAQWEMLRRDRTALVMSRKQADSFHKKVGDTFTLVAPQTARADGTNLWTFHIADIYEDVPQFPGGMIAGAYDAYDKAVPLADQGKMNEVDILATDPAQAPALAERIDRLFANSPTPTQSQTEKMIYSSDNGDLDVKALTRKIAVIGLVMILFLIANVIAQSVRERQAEFATLKTMGFSDRLMVLLVVLEAALPCLAGALCGVALAAGLAQQIPLLLPRGYGIPTPTMAPSVFLWALGSAGLLALISAALPILRLTRMDIATALSRHAA